MAFRVGIVRGMREGDSEKSKVRTAWLGGRVAALSLEITIPG